MFERIGERFPGSRILIISLTLKSTKENYWAGSPSGLFTIRFSVSSNKGRFNGGRGIEGIGVPPHEIVPPRAEDLLKEHDTLIERAEQLLKTGFPKDVVPYTGADSR